MATLYPNILCSWCGAHAFRGPGGGAVCPTCRRVWNDGLLEEEATPVWPVPLLEAQEPRQDSV